MLGRAAVEVEGAVRQVTHHLVFVLGAAVDLLQRLELVEVEGGKTIELHRAEVAARALDPQHLHVLLRQRVALHQLGGGVAAAVIRDAQVGAQQVGAVEQPAGLIEAVGVVGVPGGKGQGLCGSGMSRLEGRGSRRNLVAGMHKDNQHFLILNPRNADAWRHL
jgi:hypothetical protein